MKKIFTICFISAIYLTSFSQGTFVKYSDNFIDELSAKDLSYFNEEIFSNPDELYILDSTVGFKFFTETDSASIFKTIISYNEYENSQTTISYDRQSEDFLWDNYSKTIRYFNDSDLLEMIIYYQGDGQIWIKRQKSVYEYNSNLETVLYISYMWDEVLYDWYLSSKTEVEYYSSGNKRSRTMLTFDRENEVWVNNSKTEYYYDAENRIISELSSWWDTAGSFWNQISWQSFEYTDTGKIIVNYQMDSTGWIPYDRSEENWSDDYHCYSTREKYINDTSWLFVYEADCSFNEDDLLIAQESYRFLEPDSVWIGDVKFEKNINDKGQTIDLINYSWDFWNETWELNTMLLYGYNELDIQFYSCTKVYTEGLWEKGWSQVKYYSDPYGVSDNPVTDENVLVYPNPASSYITKLNPNAIIQLHNHQGQLILKSTPGEDQVSLKGLTPGVYIAIIIEDEKIIGKEKLVIQ